MLILVLCSFGSNEKQLLNAKGKVVDTDGKPLLGVVVRTYYNSGEIYSVTDSLGYFQFIHLPSDHENRFLFDKEGFFSKEILLNPDFFESQTPNTVVLSNRSEVCIDQHQIKDEFLGLKFKKFIRKYHLKGYQFERKTSIVNTDTTALMTCELRDHSRINIRINDHSKFLKKNKLANAKVIGVDIISKNGDKIDLGYETCIHPNKYNLLGYKSEETKLIFFDSLRMRKIPVAIYQPKDYSSKEKQKLAIISHGYGHNRPSSYLGYSFIANDLVSKGYFVVSIQHELATDDSLPKTGNMQVVRMPFWERGVKNIDFVLNKIAREYDFVDTANVTLIGHSNGGDMSILFSHKFPEKINKVITLDNRRMPFPRVKAPHIYSLRSCDFQADEGVLPTIEEQYENNIVIVQMSDIKHDDMCNAATKEQQAEMLLLIRLFLNH